MFEGFPKDGVLFLKELTDNNDKEWFADQKKRFKSQLEAPAKAFVAEMEDRLGEEWNSKIFRIYRDVRFSKDKTPYNTHLRIGFTRDGEASLFFSLEPEELILGSGVYEFSKEALTRYREAVAGSQGTELVTVIDDLQGQGFRLDEPELKRVPRGLDKDHPRGSLLRRKSLALWRNDKVPKAIHGPDAVDHCLGVFEQLADLRSWMRGIV
jgi:uncharacterized protein (TIGR02453 family)